MIKLNLIFIKKINFNKNLKFKNQVKNRCHLILKSISQYYLIVVISTYSLYIFYAHM